MAVMRVAVIGGGSAGLTCAWLLQAEHDVVLFEAAERVGGHIHTVTVDDGPRRVPVELGAEFFFEEGYGGLHALLGRFGLRTVRERLRVSFTMPGRSGPIVVPPRDAATLRTCLSPAAARDLVWFWRFSAAGERVVAEGDRTLSVQRLVDRCGVPRDVADRLVVPLIASSWGMSPAMARELSAYGVVRVMGLRASQDAHSFRVEGGLAGYTDRLAADSPRCDLRLRAPVEAVARVDGSLRVRAAGATEAFDAVVLACDWHTAARVCAGEPQLAAWAAAFGAFEDYRNTLTVHRDRSLMPPDPRHWGSSNFSLTRDRPPRTTVWSGRPSGAAVFRTWMRDGEPEPRSTTHVAHYRHIACTVQHPARQAALARLQGTAGVWAAGMYTDGVDNHESALRSALTVARRLAPDGERVRWFATKVSR